MDSCFRRNDSSETVAGRIRDSWFRRTNWDRSASQRQRGQLAARGQLVRDKRGS